MQLKHEFSLCRVYVTSGCARAFDRRPLGTIPNIHTQNLTTNNGNQLPQEVPGGSGASSSSLQNASATATVPVMERSGSTDSLDSEQNDRTALQATASGSATNNKKYDVEMAEALEPLLDWEQLDWP